MSTAWVYLAELTAYDLDTQAVRVLRYSSGSGFRTGGTDTPAHTEYDAVIEQAVELSRHAFSPGTTEGQTRVGFGDLVLLNPDGDLDPILRYAIDGREVIVRRAPVGSTSLADFVTVFRGTADRVEYSTTRITVKLRDRQAALALPLQANTYAGTNVLPAGLEGVPGDLQGKRKPLVFGAVTNLELPCVNTARLIYQAHDGALASVDGVYDRGISLAVSGTYATLGDLLDDAQAPAAGTCKVFLDGGYVRLGSSPVGQITADVTQGAPGDRSAAALFEAILTRMGVAPADIRAADLAALEAQQPAPLGAAFTDTVTAADAVDVIANTVGAWWGVTADGTYRIARLRRPTGDVVHTFTADDLIGPPRSISTADVARGMPAWAVTVRYAKNETVQADVAFGVSDARRGELAEQWREVRVEDPTVQTAHALATTLTYDTAFRTEADARREAERRLRLRGLRRHRFDITVLFDEDTAALDIGDVVGLRHPRFGLTVTGDDVGQKFVVLGVEPDAQTGRVTLTLWGNSFTTYNLVTHLGDFLGTDLGDFLVTDSR
ncbi:hypothetical protein [Gemmatimonas sp.]|uniref:hypothetical protein n=1 Tax=Gemmatimonas sp. TaxID=1962908 RepID=UPI00333F8D55